MTDNDFYLKIRRLDPRARIDAPARMGDAGYDIHVIDTITIAPGERKVLHTGLAMEFPRGFVGIMENKSGMASKTMLFQISGVIDSGYRGEVCPIVHNIGTTPIVLDAGQKVCQMVFYRIASAEIEYVDELSDSERGDGAFGSTGLN